MWSPKHRQVLRQQQRMPHGLRIRTGMSRKDPEEGPQVAKQTLRFRDMPQHEPRMPHGRTTPNRQINDLPERQGQRGEKASQTYHQQQTQYLYHRQVQRSRRQLLDRRRRAPRAQPTSAQAGK